MQYFNSLSQIYQKPLSAVNYNLSKENILLIKSCMESPTYIKVNLSIEILNLPTF